MQENVYIMVTLFLIRHVILVWRDFTEKPHLTLKTVSYFLPIPPCLRFLIVIGHRTRDLTCDYRLRYVHLPLRIYVLYVGCYNVYAVIWLALCRFWVRWRGYIMSQYRLSLVQIRRLFIARGEVWRFDQPGRIDHNIKTLFFIYYT